MQLIVIFERKEDENTLCEISEPLLSVTKVSV